MVNLIIIVEVRHCNLKSNITMTLDEKSPSGKYCCKILIFLAKLANTVSSKVILKLQDSGTKSYQRHMTSVRQLVYQTFLRLIPRVVGQI